VLSIFGPLSLAQRAATVVANPHPVRAPGWIESSLPCSSYTGFYAAPAFFLASVSFGFRQLPSAGAPCEACLSRRAQRRRSGFSSAHKGSALPFFRRLPRAACRCALLSLVRFSVSGSGRPYVASRARSLRCSRFPARFRLNRDKCVRSREVCADASPAGLDLFSLSLGFLAAAVESLRRAKVCSVWRAVPPALCFGLIYY
jgi:hypothetical protein